MAAENGITTKEQLFVTEYLQHFNIARAAENLGLQANNLYAAGYNIFKKPAVQRLLSIEIAKRNNLAQADMYYVIQRLVEVIEVDLVEWALKGEEGASLRELREMPPEVRKLVTGIERKEVYNPSTTETTVTVKFKMMDKTKCLELLGKQLGMFAQNVNVKADVRVSSYVDWKASVKKRREQQLEEMGEVIDVEPR
jgi:phage terminase small subunit